MKATLYLALYVLFMSLDKSGFALIFFLLLFRSLFIKSLMRVSTNWLRILMLTLLLPCSLLDYLVTTLRYAPKELLTFRPYALTWALYRMQVKGQFVPNRYPKESS